MSPFDIQHVITGFAETAKGTMEAGFDGVEVHGAHGYLLSQFLSAYSNQRSDEYGGSVPNRYRIAHETIQAVRAVVPRDRLLTFRISNWGIADMEVSLFESREEYQALIRLLAQEPIDAISVSTYDAPMEAFGSGKIPDRASAEDALQDADIVLSGKSMLLNPDWVADLRAGKPLAPHSSEEANIAYTETPLP